MLFYLLILLVFMITIFIFRKGLKDSCVQGATVFIIFIITLIVPVLIYIAIIPIINIKADILWKTTEIAIYPTNNGGFMDVSINNNENSSDPIIYYTVKDKNGEETIQSITANKNITKIIRTNRESPKLITYTSYYKNKYLAKYVGSYPKGEHYKLVIPELK